MGCNQRSSPYPSGFHQSSNSAATLVTKTKIRKYKYYTDTNRVESMLRSRHVVLRRSTRLSRCQAMRKNVA